ncbi:MAG: hypothetical protein VB070_13140 [Clostridiaceae bacterium]|nr:hypothetical protein [Clostridiaceae bacterium]
MMDHIILNGIWDIAYSPEEAGEFGDTVALDFVPAYWEDRTNTLQRTALWNSLRFNPGYRLQRYPVEGTVPDMSLPNIVGRFRYTKTVFIDKNYEHKLALFQVGGVQNSLKLFINGIEAGSHIGFNTPFTFDIGAFIHYGEDNEIIMEVSNFPLLNEIGESVSGCTVRAANEATGGIYGDVALIFKPLPALTDAFITTAENAESITVNCSCTEPAPIHWEIYDKNGLMDEGLSESSVFTVTRGSMRFWSPETPYLYTLKLTLAADSTELVFGIRRLTTHGSSFSLNHEPVYLRGICEHGYYPDTVHPPRDINYYRDVIITLKQLGFNFIRFHTWIPMEEYMRAADELGIMLHVESPNNTTTEEWIQILKYVRRHPSVVICCCGNELLIDDAGVDKLEHHAALCRELMPDALFSPMNALRGVEYGWLDSNLGVDLCYEPFKHNDKRLNRLIAFSDVFNSYALGQLSYNSISADPAELDHFQSIYKRPRISHEIGIHGTYIDLGLSRRYKGTRIGDTELFSSVESHLESEGVLKRAPLYYVNSCKWQALLRKHCFENARRCKTIAGYDFLGVSDHHWHTFGYAVGLMNEFYELKPTESIRNIRQYNNESVLLIDLANNRNYFCGGQLKCRISVSYFGKNKIDMATLRCTVGNTSGHILKRFNFRTGPLISGQVVEIADITYSIPSCEHPEKLLLRAELDDVPYPIENEWEIWAFPETESAADGILCVDSLNNVALASLNNGADVLLLGSEPFNTLPVSFQIALAGRTNGNLATVIEHHPLTDPMGHEGWCGWQFSSMMTDASAVVFNRTSSIPFKPIIEVASSYKNVHKQAAVFELNVGRGRLLICTFRLSPDDPGACWFKKRMLEYMRGASFSPQIAASVDDLRTIFSASPKITAIVNDNSAHNPNDITMKK